MSYLKKYLFLFKPRLSIKGEGGSWIFQMINKLYELVI